jgi:hypothetical protein
MVIFRLDSKLSESRYDRFKDRSDDGQTMMTSQVEPTSRANEDLRFDKLHPFFQIRSHSFYHEDAPSLGTYFYSHISS